MKKVYNMGIILRDGINNFIKKFFEVLVIVY